MQVVPDTQIKVGTSANSVFVSARARLPWRIGFSVSRDSILSLLAHDTALAVCGRVVCKLDDWRVWAWRWNARRAKSVVNLHRDQLVRVLSLASNNVGEHNWLSLHVYARGAVLAFDRSSRKLRRLRDSADRFQREALALTALVRAIQEGR